MENLQLYNEDLRTLQKAVNECIDKAKERALELCPFRVGDKVRLYRVESYWENADGKTVPVLFDDDKEYEFVKRSQEVVIDDAFIAHIDVSTHMSRYTYRFRSVKVDGTSSKNYLHIPHFTRMELIE